MLPFSFFIFFFSRFFSGNFCCYISYILEPETILIFIFFKKEKKIDFPCYLCTLFAYLSAAQTFLCGVSLSRCDGHR